VPIVTVIDMELTKSPTQAARNFHKVDWDSFHKTLEGKPDKHESPTYINSPTVLNRICDKLTSAIQETIEAEVPTTEICTRSKCWWSKELTLLRKAMEKLGHNAYKARHWLDHPVHIEHTEACKKYNKTIQHAKQHHW
jgi:hypothetical protein